MKKQIFLSTLIFLTFSQLVEAGCLSGDCKNGYGVYTWSGRGEYAGDWKNGKKHGYGEQNWSDGSKYEGDYKNGKFHGQGTYWKNGERYVGQWKNGKRHGNGTLYYRNGNVKQRGIWENARYVGPSSEQKILTTSKSTGSVMTWNNPKSTSTKVSSSRTTIEACIKSGRNAQLYVNNALIHNMRGIKAVPRNRSCKTPLVKSVRLRTGKNIIKITVNDASGRTISSEERIIFQRSNQREKRVALVIGNRDYATAPLRNPVNDALAMTQVLQEVGFDVMSHTDIGKKKMAQVINRFGKKIAKGGVGLFYFAGHGMQVKGENYLIPVDVNTNGERAVKRTSIKLAQVTRSMKSAGNRMNIIILDACRDNPFRTITRGFNQPIITRGALAKIDAPYGTYIAFATAPGSRASDGDGSNGLYTEALKEVIKIPELKIEDVFKRVRKMVHKQSGGSQQTWDNTSIVGDFYFNR